MRKSEFFKLSLCYDITNGYCFKRRVLSCISDNNIKYYWSKYRSSVCFRNNYRYED
jgi:hypothetical protein